MTKRKTAIGRRGPKQFQPDLEAEVLNMRTYNFFLGALSQIALSMFQWENLPESMNQLWLENCLFENGQAALLYDRDFGFINTRSVINGKLNIYGRPVSLQCYSFGYTKIREVYDGLVKDGPIDEQCILVENTVQRNATFPTLQLFAYRMANAQRSEDVNIKNQKFPYYIECDERQKMTIINAYQQIDGNSPVILGDKNGALSDAFKSISTVAPYVADKIQLYRRQIFREALEFLGVNCVVDNKRERLIADEANANNEVVNLNLQAFLVPRQRAASQFNEKYASELGGKEISVKIRSDLYNLIKQVESIVAPYNEEVNNEASNSIRTQE